MPTAPVSTESSLSNWGSKIAETKSIFRAVFHFCFSLGVALFPMDCPANLKTHDKKYTVVVAS